MEETGLRVLVELLSNGNWIADVEESYTGSTTDRGGSDPRELLEDVFSWAGMPQDVSAYLLTDDPTDAAGYFAGVVRRSKDYDDLELRIFMEITG